MNRNVTYIIVELGKAVIGLVAEIILRKKKKKKASPEEERQTHSSMEAE